MVDLGTNSEGNHKNAKNEPAPVFDNPSFYEITITLDSDYAANATDLAITRTIIYESSKAYLSYITQEAFTSTMAQRLISLSLDLGNDPNTAQHIELSNSFVGAISNSLENWLDSDLSSDLYYDYLSWSGGMTQTEAFSLKPPTFQTNSINANIAEGNAATASTSAAQGINDINCQ